MAIMVVWGAIGKRLSPSLSTEMSSRPRRCTARLFHDLACDPCPRIETMGLKLTRMAVLQDHLQDEGLYSEKFVVSVDPRAEVAYSKRTPIKALARTVPEPKRMMLPEQHKLHIRKRYELAASL